MANEKVVELLNNAGTADFTAAEAGAAVTLGIAPFAKRTAVMAFVLGTFVGTVKIQGSDDGTTWTDLMTATMSEMKQVAAYPYMRANCTAYTSGTIKARIAA